MADAIILLDFLEKLDSLGIQYSLHETDGTISISGDLNFRDLGLKEIPIKIKDISGDFICSKCELTSLNNFPDTVGGNFDCSDNNLTSLKGCPQKVGGYFDCSNNKLTSLEGCPAEVTGLFDCNKNIGLKSLKGIGKTNSLIYSDFFEGKIDSYKGEL